MAGVISGYPLDTLRIRQQQHSNAGSALNILRRVIDAEGPSALYRGMGAPLASVTFQVRSSLSLSVMKAFPSSVTCKYHSGRMVARGITIFPIK